MDFPDLIGVSGTLGSGKDSLSHLLVEKFGFGHVSTSDLVREIALKVHGSVERPILYQTGGEYRHRHGAGYFVELALAKKRPLVVTGIRSLGEMKVIKEAGGVMVFVDAPIEVRYQRMTARDRDHEVEISLDEFRIREEKEMYSGPGDADFNIRAIGEQADIRLNNTSTFEEFEQRAIQALQSCRA